MPQEENSIIQLPSGICTGNLYQDFINLYSPPGSEPATQFKSDLDRLLMWKQKYRCVFTASEIERFWSRVDKNGPTVKEELGPCWLWKNKPLPSGYGNWVVSQFEKSAQNGSASWSPTASFAAFLKLAVSTRGMFGCLPSNSSPIVRI